VTRVLIAGGTGPLGSAIAAELSRRGWSVCIQYRSRVDAATAVLNRLSPGRHCVLPADLRKPEEAAHLASRAEARLGGTLDAVVNCAWPSHASTPIAEADPGLVESALDGVRTQLNLAVATLPSLRETAGAFVMLGGALAHRRHPGLGLYSLSKAAAENACLTMALEEGVHGVRVNVIAPGRVRVEPDLAETDPGYAALEAIASQRRSLPLPTPDQIAALAAYLVGPDATAVTGQVLSVAGGEQW